MSQVHIRIARTKDIDKVLSFLKRHYSILSEAEIIKLALSEKYKKEVKETEISDGELRKQFYHAIEEGGKVGDKLFAERGLKRENLTEQEIYDIFLDTLKHD